MIDFCVSVSSGKSNDDNSYFNEYESTGQFREYQILISSEGFFENNDFVFNVIIEKNCTLNHLNLTVES